MKVIYMSTNPYRELPADYRDRYESIWITPPNQELCEPEKAGQYFRWTLEELDAADAAGFDGLGTNEHHSNAYAMPVSPHMTAGILASRQSDAAICIIGTTLPIYPPLRAAEELALIDTVSGGRLVTGWPIGSPMDTTGVYGIPPTQVRSRYYEAHDFIKQAWTRPGPYPFNGRYTKQRYVNPWPQPLQDPHPPIWLAGGGSVETWRFAAEHDYMYCYLSLWGYNSGKALLQSYRDMLESYGRDDNPYRTGYIQLVCVADTDAEAKRLYEPHIKEFYSKAMYVAPQHSAVPGFMSRTSLSKMMEKVGAASPFGGNPFTDSTYEEIVESGAVIAGSPETVAQRMEEAARDLRVGHLLVQMQLQSMGPELTKYSIGLFGEHVLPRLQKLWDDEGYQDHWWPSGATRQPRAAAPSVEAVTA